MMLLDKDKGHNIYTSILSIALTWAVLVFVDHFYQLRLSLVLSGFTALLCGLLIYIYDNNRKNPITYLILLTMAAGIALYVWIGGIEPLRWLDKIYDWILNYNGSRELYVGSYAIFIIIVIGLLLSIILYILLKNYIARIIMSIIILMLMIVASVQGVEVPKIVVAMVVFYILSIIVELSSKQYKKKLGIEEKKEGVLYLMIICLILALLSTSLPSKEEPIQWLSIRRVYNNVKTQINHWQLDWKIFRGRESDEFGLSITGYSEGDRKLGSGDIIRDDNIALMISGTESSDPLYLTGSVSSIYTGDKWKKSPSYQIDNYEEYRLDYMEMLYGLSRTNEEVLTKERIVRRRAFNLTYKNIATKTVFYPLKFTWASWHKNDKLLTETANISSPSRIDNEWKLHYTFYEMNQNGDSFYKMMLELDDFSYEDKEVVNIERTKEIEKELFKHSQAKGIVEVEGLYDLLKERSEVIYREYLNLPEELPDRVRDLADELTKGFTSDYEKLKAIETYLRGYSYTLTPGGIPKGADFVDNFLFEKAEGYCTSFASAMAVLGRCIGVPTRYVEGFLVNFDDTDNNRIYPARNSNAHAWAEAYIEGFGWVPFETSPGQYSSRYNSWINWRDREAIHGDKIELPIDRYEPPTAVIRPPIEEVEDEVDESEVGEFWSLIFMLIITFAMFALLLVFYYLFLKKRYKKEFSNASYSKKTYMLFIRILRLLNYERFELEVQETILALSHRIGDSYEYDGIRFEEVARIYMRYRYGEEDLLEEDYRQMAVFHDGLLEERRKRVSRLKFAMEDLMLLRVWGDIFAS